MKQVSEADSGKSSAWKVTVLSREEQYDLKRKVLIQEAARAFSTRGYHATSLADVARELGVTKGAHIQLVEDGILIPPGCCHAVTAWIEQNW